MAGNENRIEGSHKANIILFATVLIVCSILSYFFALGYEDDKPLLGEVFRLLAGSLLTTAIFGILLGLSDFVKFVSFCLRGIIVEHSYLEKLSPENKEYLKTKIDSAILGEETTKSPDSLYRFVDAQLPEMYKHPYRREFHDLHYYYNSEKDGFWEVHQQMSYVLYQSLINPMNLEVRFARSFKKPDDIEKYEDMVISSEVHVGKDEFRLTRESISREGNGLTQGDGNAGESESNETKFFLEPDRKNKLLEVPVDIQVSKQLLGGREIITMQYAISLDRNKIRGVQEIKVSIKNKHYISKTENSHYLTMGAPTRDMLLGIHFNCGEFETYASGFGFNPDACEMRRERNSAFVDIKEWLLPGHGAVITWREVEN